MTDIALRGDLAPAIIEAPSMLVAWANAAGAAHQLAGPLCRTDFVPAHFKGNPDAATAAILYGAEAGLSPLQALQGVYVIGGKPAMYARTLLAVTLSKGHQVWTEELTDSRAVVCGRRRGTEHVERVVWSMDRARKAGYTKNAKYNTDPQSMLLARAQADVCRRIAPDALLGMAYSVEELEDEAVPKTTMQREAPAKRTMRRSSTEPPPVEEPALEPPALGGDGGEVDTPPASEPITRPQLSKLHALFGELGVVQREQRLVLVAEIVGRHAGSLNDLTKAEASRLIDTLEQRAQQTAPVEDPPDFVWGEQQ